VANIILIGMMGSGKTTVAKLLAASKDYQLIDADQEMAFKFGKPISEVFTNLGEEEFRKTEKQFYDELLAQSTDGLIISTGGGAILRSAEVLKKLGTVVWLKASLNTIYTRLAADSNNVLQRPLLAATSNLRSELSTLYAFRRPLYESTADLIVDVEEKTPEQIADEILVMLD
jgi:shikimate kinase